MLNELLLIERSARESGIEMVQPHPDMNDAKKMPTLKTLLNGKGEVVSVQLIPDTVTPWTLRDGKHNSFPFVQPKTPLIRQISGQSELKTIAVDKKREKNERRDAILKIANNSCLNNDAVENWPGTKMLNRIWERMGQLSYIDEQISCVVLATFERFLRSFDPAIGGNSSNAFSEIVARLTENLELSSLDGWVEIATGLLLGKFDKKKNAWLCDAALVFEADGFHTSIIEKHHIMPVSKALNRFTSDAGVDNDKNECGLMGGNCTLHKGNFPQPNIRILGPTYIFSKNKEIQANDRYGRFASDAMPIGANLVTMLGGALSAITSPERKNITWRSIPGEKPKQTDILIAFVENAMDVPIAESLAEEDFSEEEIDDTDISKANLVAIFEKRTERLIEMVRAKSNADLSEISVRLTVLRKVDPANRKSVYSNTLTVSDIQKAANLWVQAEKNVPIWINLPVLKKGERIPTQIPPQHVAPLGLIAFSKQIFLRCGTERHEVPGMPASEAFKFFLQNPTNKNLSKMVLRLVISRRATLLTNVAHLAHTPNSWRHRKDTIREKNILVSLNRESLKTVTVLGLTLFKIGRKREVYMNDTAFKLGQLLAAADIVHAGYCADVRGGDIPPSLLGNQVFVMAQHAPAKALSTLCRRWKPYDGWAKKTVRDLNRINTLTGSKNPIDKDRGWDIKKALRNAREMRTIAEELTFKIGDCRANDEFRAELLLGYLAGLPKSNTQESAEKITESHDRKEKK